MLGISQSIFNEVGGGVKGWLKNPLNQTFFFWYFLPAAGSVFLQLFVVGPALGYAAPDVLSGEVTLPEGLSTTESLIALIVGVLSGSFVALILLPLFLGIVLMALSGSILRFYQGALPIERRLLAPWLKRSRNRSDAIYGDLKRKRREYFFLASRGIRLVIVDGQEQAHSVGEEERTQLIDQLKQDIQALHERHEETYLVQQLPIAGERAAPTALGNALAVAEEYPFERYGIDAVVFWPRLRSEIEPEKIEPLDATFAAMNGLLNISLLAFLFGIEALIVGLIGLIGRAPRWEMFALALFGVVVAVGAYAAAVSAAHAVGNLMKTFFDYYRGRVLERFNLTMPEDIEEERVVWLKLAAFVRRGESFYYPSEWRRE